MVCDSHHFGTPFSRRRILRHSREEHVRSSYFFRSKTDDSFATLILLITMLATHNMPKFEYYPSSISPRMLTQNLSPFICMYCLPVRYPSGNSSILILGIGQVIWFKSDWVTAWVACFSWQLVTYTVFRVWTDFPCLSDLFLILGKCDVPHPLQIWNTGSKILLISLENSWLNPNVVDFEVTMTWRSG